MFGMVLDNTRLRKTVELKDAELGRVWTSLKAAQEDVKRLTSICKEPAEVRVKVELFEAGITKLEAFKSEAFKKFFKATAGFTKRIGDSNKEVLDVLNRAEKQAIEAGPSRKTIPPSPVKMTQTRPALVEIPTPTYTPVAPSDPKGKTAVEEATTPPPRPVGNPANRTRLSTTHLDTEAWGQSPASQKLHEQKGVEHSEEATADTRTTIICSDEDEEDYDHEIIGGVKRRAGRIAATPLKKLRKVESNRPGGE